VELDLDQRLSTSVRPGATAVEEVAFTSANACAYVEACLAAGIDVNAFGQRLSFFFNAHKHFLEEIAKFRARGACGPG
jgi:methylmalonyl-CoA mutase N-terminal domain/subunit